MDRHDFEIPVTFKHRVIFTRDAFAPGNRALADVLAEGGGRRVLVFLETAVAESWKGLSARIQDHFGGLDLDFRGVRIFGGGEPCKADQNLVHEVWREIDLGHIDRHSYVLAIGGGAFLDAVGFAASTAHRGVRLVRFPTTTLSQDDSGVGVKNAINGFGKKNWIGSFGVPFAVINDFQFLESQDRGAESLAGEGSGILRMGSRRMPLRSQSWSVRPSRNACAALPCSIPATSRSVGTPSRPAPAVPWISATGPRTSWRRSPNTSSPMPRRLR